MYERDNSYGCLAFVVAPLFIVVALIMITLGWALDNGYLNETQLTEKLPDVVQTVVVEAEKVVVPNGEQQEVVVLPNGDLPVVVPNGDLPQPISPPVVISQPVRQAPVSAPVIPGARNPKNGRETRGSVREPSGGSVSFRSVRESGLSLIEKSTNKNFRP